MLKASKLSKIIKNFLQIMMIQLNRTKKIYNMIKQNINLIKNTKIKIVQIKHLLNKFRLKKNKI